MRTPIGLVYLFRTILPKLLLPPFLVYVLLNLTNNTSAGATSSGHLSTFSTWLILFLSLLTHPIYLFLSVLYTNVRNKRDAAKRNAVLIPQVELGSFEIVRKIVESFTKGYPGDVYHEWSKTYGNYFGINILGESRMMTFEPDHIKAILATQFDSFVKGPILYDQFGSLLGSGVFNSDGEMWKFHRTMTRPFFSKERVSDYDIFDLHAEGIIKAMKKRVGAGYPVEFQDAVSRFTLDSATEFLFGKDVNSLGAGLPYPPPSSTFPPQTETDFIPSHPSNLFAQSFLEAQELTGFRTRYGIHWRLFSGEFWADEVGKRRKVVESGFVEPVLGELMREGKEKKEDQEEEGKEETFLNHLVRCTEDKQIIRDELLNMLVASRDTTASLLTFAVYVLSQRPDIEKRLREEIYEALGRSDKRPTYEIIKEMKYLRAFLNETLRLYPPVPFDARASTTATVIYSKSGPPVYIPEGMKCLYSVFLMHRRKDLWGPDALEFDPDRFLDDRLHKYLTPNPYIFLPFNAGPRICLGQQFAYNEASYFLIKFLQSFGEIRFADDIQYLNDASNKNGNGDNGPLMYVKPPEEWAQAQEEGRKEMEGTTKGRDKVMFTMHLTMAVRGGLWVRMKSLDKGSDLEEDV
ncbi:cytochrome P450 [Dendrothele bispora CBS 962.96]|uniref:Cytochrome P450 n=1 Tax=Dendrothele bispora (strain CBS 962.96) TaxID=1314807 RepID=A0A4S8MF18_DENBC|nr:cytochrome P450 [Dendrothele bispora CBS 962.96]